MLPFLNKLRIYKAFSYYLLMHFSYAVVRCAGYGLLLLAPHLGFQHLLLKLRNLLRKGGWAKAVEVVLISPTTASC